MKGGAMATPLETVDRALGELRAQRELAIVQWRAALDLGPEYAPKPDAFALTDALDDMLDSRNALARAGHL